MDATTEHHAEKHARVEDNALVRGNGRYAADVPLPNQAYAYFVRSPHAAARIVSIDTSAAEKAPGVVGVLTAKDMDGRRQSRPPSAGARARRQDADPAAPAGVCRRARGAYRRAGGDGGGGELCRRAGCRRVRHRRIRGDDAGHRCARGVARRRAASLAAGARQYRGRLAGTESRCGRQRQEGRGDFRFGQTRRTRQRDEPAHGRQLHGAARRHRELRSGKRQLSDARLLARRRRHARRHHGDHESAEGAHPRAHRRRRRRVRHQDRALSGKHRASGRRQETRPADPLDVDALGSVSHRQPGARYLFGSRAGARREGKIPGAAHQECRQSRRLCGPGRRQHPDREFHPLPARHVRHQGHRRVGGLRVHQHHPDRALSRRRTAGSELCARARGRRGGAHHRHRSGETAPAQPDQKIGDAVQDRGRHHLRFRRLRADPRQGARACRLRRLQAAPPRVATARQISRLRHLLSARTFRRRADRERQAELSGRRHAAADAQCAEYRPGPRHGVPARHRRDARHSGGQDSAYQRRFRKRAARLCLGRLALGDDRRPFDRQGDGHHPAKGQADRRRHAGNR